MNNFSRRIKNVRQKKWNSSHSQSWTAAAGGDHAGAAAFAAAVCGSFSQSRAASPPTRPTPVASAEVQ